EVGEDVEDLAVERRYVDLELLAAEVVEPLLQVTGNGLFRLLHGEAANYHLAEGAKADAAVGAHKVQYYAGSRVERILHPQHVGWLDDVRRRHRRRLARGGGAFAALRPAGREGVAGKCACSDPDPSQQ